MRYSIISLVTSVTLAAPAALPAAEAPELKKLHVLLVIDSSDKNLAESVQIDQRRIEWMLRRNIPSSRYTLTSLVGPKATRGNILAHYRNHPAARDEGLV